MNDGVTVNEAPAYYIVAVPDLPDGQLCRHDRQLLRAARGLADEAGGAVLAVIFGEPRDDLAASGVDRFVTFQGQTFAGYAPEARAAAIVAITSKVAARHLLLPDSLAGGADLGRRVGAILGERAAGDAWRISLTETTRLAAARNYDITLATPRVVLLADDAAAPRRAQRHEARAVATLKIAVQPHIRDLGPLQIEPEAVALEEAELIMAGGRGVTDWHSFYTAANLMGAAIAGSRGVVDSGQMPRSRQISPQGQYGAAHACLSFGMSCTRRQLDTLSERARVVAINQDPNCAAMRRADLAIVGDAQAILPEFVKLLDRRRGRG